MNEAIEKLKAELERFARENDAVEEEALRRMRNITRETGEFLRLLVLATAARTILEIGTSNGYSTLWLAEAAAALGGSVTTVEASEYKVGLAVQNFTRSGLDPVIILLHEDAGTALQSFKEHQFDFIFLDSNRSAYPGWWPDVRRVLRPGGVLAADNATSHTEELAPFMDIVQADAVFTTSIVQVGKGEFLAVKAL